MNTYSEESNKQPHFVLWLPQQFPVTTNHLAVSLAEPGLCMLLQQPIAVVALSILSTKRTGAYPSIILRGSMLPPFLFSEESMRRNGRLKCNCAKAMGFIGRPRRRSTSRV